MAITLYDATVPSFLQILAAVRGYLDKALAHANETGADPEAWAETRLYEDMWPLRAQIVSVAHHSRGALEGVERGAFAPPLQSEENFAGLQALVAEAEADVGRFTPQMVNSFAGRDLAFQVGGRTLSFVAEDFLLSFSLPNFYFHAATGYDILRMKGVPLGKRDFLGRYRMKSPG
jgi:hypothetical protein